MSREKKARFSVKWDVRTGSPRKLWRALHDFLDDNGFVHEYAELRPEGGPIEGTATFSDWLIGYRDHVRPASFWVLRVVVGLVLCLTVVLLPVGLSLIRGRLRTVRTWARVGIEGEVYRTRGASVDAAHAEEVLDVVADARVTLEIQGSEASNDIYPETARLTEDEGDIGEVERHFKELNHRLDELLERQSLSDFKLLE